MNERPISFSPDMVAAICAGRKTVTRRVVKPQPPEQYFRAISDYNGLTGWYDGGDPEFAEWWPEHSVIPSPYGLRGDRLWVREQWRVKDHDFARPCPSAWLLENRAGETWWVNPPEDRLQEMAAKFGTADTHGGPDPRWRQARFMFRWCSRLTLEVVSVRVERLKDISEADAIAEGIAYLGIRRLCKAMPVYHWDPLTSIPDGYDSPRIAYFDLWDRINGKGSWAFNPWVWVIGFVPAGVPATTGGEK